MKFRLLVIALFIFTGGMVSRNHQTEAIIPQPTVQEEAAILASTLQIAMFEHAPEAGGAEPGGRGLATLVAHGGELLIVTHDHWTHLTPALHEVELRNAAGDLLLTLDAHTFRALIVYRDGGTLVLRAPAALRGPVPAAVGRLQGEGTAVWLARRAAASGVAAVEVVAATVTGVQDGTGPTQVQLRTQDGSALLPGDSGGGVWLNGRLAGNVWAAGVRERRYFWSDWLGRDTSEPSDLVIGAPYPLGGEAGSPATAPSDTETGSPLQAPKQEQEMETRADKLQATLLAE